MTYKEQSSVPFLQKYLTSQPFKDILSQVSFSYGHSVISIKEVGYKNRITTYIKEVGYYKFVEFFIRKLAHFSTYFVMGLGFYMTLKDNLKKWQATFFSYLAAVGYAGIDEFHQMITGDRTPSFEDVMLDGIGALTGIIITMVILYFFTSSNLSSIYADLCDLDKYIKF